MDSVPCNPRLDAGDGKRVLSDFLKNGSTSAQLQPFLPASDQALYSPGTPRVYSCALTFDDPPSNLPVTISRGSLSGAIERGEADHLYVGELECRKSKDIKGTLEANVSTTGPRSSRSTVTEGSSLRRAARAHPAVPPKER